MVNIENLSILYFSTDSPVPYKLKCGEEIFIYPIRVKDWGTFNCGLDIITIDKDQISDIEVMKMSYLKFLKTLFNQDENLRQKLNIILRYSLKEDAFQIVQIKDRENLCILDEDNIVKYYITSKEFDEIKKIILFQNIYDYDDRYVDPEIKKMYEDIIRIKNKDVVNPTLERKKIFMISECGLSLEKIDNMSYRMFEQTYRMKVSIDLYRARKIMQASQKYDIKEEIIYPLYEKEKDKYDDIFVEKSKVTNKLSKVQ